MSKKINYISKICIIIGIISIFSAISLVLYNIISDYIAGKKAKNVLSYMDNIIQNDTQEESATKIEFDGNNYIGIISIDSLNLRLPVLAYYSENNLKIAPTLYSGSIENNDAVIIAHNYTTHFGNLEKLNIGDKVTFENINKKIYNYEVVSKEEINQDDTLMLYENEWDLTLFTCKNIDFKYRTVIRLKRL